MDVVVGMSTQGDGLLTSERIDGGEHVAERGRHVDPLQLKLHLPRLDFREVEDVVDEVQKVPPAAVNLVHETLARDVIDAAGAIVDEQL